MCKDKSFPRVEAMCVLSNLIGLGHLAFGDFVTAWICLLGSLACAILLVGVGLGRQSEALKEAWEKENP